MYTNASIESCLECFLFIGRIDKLAKSPDLGSGSERRCRFEAYYDHENINGSPQLTEVRNLENCEDGKTL